MDTETLVKELEQVLAAFAEVGKPLDWARLVPNDAEYYYTDYVFEVYAPWLEEVSCFDAIKIVLQKMRTIMSDAAMRRIESVSIGDADYHYQPHFSQYVEIEPNAVAVESGSFAE